MLVLSRKTNEKIFIGENVSVTIVKISGNTVRIAIDAPRSVSIVREELRRREQSNPLHVAPPPPEELAVETPCQAVVEEGDPPLLIAG